MKYALRIHNLSYKLGSSLSVRAEGIHPKHRLMNFHKFFIDNISRKDLVLDIGCGKGELAYDISKKAKKVTAIDINKKNIRKAKKNFSQDNMVYLVGDATKYRFNEKFSIIILSNVLEHIKDRYRFLMKIKRLAPKILIRVPMFDRDWTVPYKKELGLKWKSDETHFTEYTLRSFQEEMYKTGLKIKKYSVQFGEIWAVTERK